jgi:hypothetical protein
MYFLVPTLFSSDLSREVSQTAQCKQAGVTNCRAVTINLEQLETVNPGDEINFISGFDLSMKVGDVEEDKIFSSKRCLFSSAVLLQDLPAAP